MGSKRGRRGLTFKWYGSSGTVDVQIYKRRAVGGQIGAVGSLNRDRRGSNLRNGCRRGLKRGRRGPKMVNKDRRGSNLENETVGSLLTNAMGLRGPDLKGRKAVESLVNSQWPSGASSCSKQVGACTRYNRSVS